MSAKYDLFVSISPISAHVLGLLLCSPEVEKSDIVFLQVSIFRQVHLVSHSMVARNFAAVGSGETTLPARDTLDLPKCASRLSSRFGMTFCFLDEGWLSSLSLMMVLPPPPPSATEEADLTIASTNVLATFFPSSIAEACVTGLPLTRYSFEQFFRMKGYANV